MRLNKNYEIKLISFSFFFFLSISFLTSYAWSSSIPIWVAFDPQKPEGSPPEVNVLESNTQHTLIEVTIPGMWVEDINEGGYNFKYIWCPGWDFTNEVGKPSLPADRESLGIPDNITNVIVNTQVLASCQFFAYLIYPYQTPNSTNWDRVNIFDFDQEYYSSNEWYPHDVNQDICTTKNNGKLIRINTVDIEITPFCFKPDLNELYVNNHIIIDVAYVCEGCISEPGENSSLPTISTSSTEKFYYDNLLLNHGYYSYSNFFTSKYLIICPPQFNELCYQFRDIMSQYYNYDFQIINSSYRSWIEVYNIIHNWYVSNEHADYVMLVGGDSLIPVPYFDSWVNPEDWGWEDPEYIHVASDYCYTLMDGQGDAKSDVAVARLSVSNTSELNNQLQKIENYYSMPTGDWEHNVTLVADRQHTTDFYPSYTVCSQIAKHYHDSYPSYYRINGRDLPPYAFLNLEVMKNIKAGRSSVVYVGHGLWDRWDRWNKISKETSESWTAYNIMQNPNTIEPVVFNIACNTGWFDGGGDCLCETWMSVTYPRGAVTTIGGTRPLFVSIPPDWSDPTDDDFGYAPYFIIKVYSFIYGDPPAADKGISCLVNVARNKMVTKHGTGDACCMHTAHSLIVLGDPALRLRDAITTLGYLGDQGEDYKKTKDKISELEKPLTFNLPEPNPVVESFSLSFYLPNPSNVTIDIYDISGRNVGCLLQGDYSSGEHSISLMAQNLKSGVYILRLSTSMGVKTQNLVVTK